MPSVRTHPLVPYAVLAFAVQYEVVVDPSVEVPEVPGPPPGPLPGEGVYWIYAALPLARGALIEAARGQAPRLGLYRMWNFELTVGMMRLAVPPHVEYPAFADAFAAQYGVRRYVLESAELFRQAARYLPYVEVVEGAANVEVDLDVGAAAALLALLQMAGIEVKEVRFPGRRYALTPAVAGNAPSEL